MSESTLSQADLAHRLEVAKAIALQAGELMKQRTGRADLSIETKSSSCDLVTEVDMACDRLISAALAQAFPQDQRVTEETWDEHQSLALESAWVVDPIDGTTNFAHGFPHFAVSIAYVRQGQPLVGVIHDPMKGETFTAIRGPGAWLNGSPIRVSGVGQLAQALLATGFPYDHAVRPQDNIPYFLAFMAACHGVRRPGSAALDLAYVACGRLDGLWEMRLAPWDVSAGVLLVEEAGGRVSTFSDTPLALTQRKITLLASNGQPDLHRGLVDICRDVARNSADCGVTA